ncbi:hypothetical protein MMIN_33910 [Mycolicibacter minnesotensis]|nr:hypothetical protein MMIN_33910 [Mycolicibacter minnesotensis]
MAASNTAAVAAPAKGRTVPAGRAVVAGDTAGWAGAIVGGGAVMGLEEQAVSSSNSANMGPARSRRGRRVKRFSTGQIFQLVAVGGRFVGRTPILRTAAR